MRVTLKCICMLICSEFILETNTLDNGLVLTPPMGFMTWQRYRCAINCELYPDECISEKLIRKIADHMANDGYLKAGYNYLIIDDCWLEKKRSPAGLLQEDKLRFPNGMPSLVDYVHSKGLKFGIYENFGNFTCAGYPGLLGHEKKDITMFAEWGIDYIKVDGCYFYGLSYEKGYEGLGRYLNKTGRPIVYSCSYPTYNDESSIPYDFELLKKNCNLWRYYDDIQDSYDSLTNIIDYFALKQDYIAKHAGPGHWNDPDMLLIGNFGLSYEQSKMQMAIWAILAAPLLMSTDLANMKVEYKEILLNHQIIEINQDPLGIQGLRVFKDNKIEVWTRKVTPADIDAGNYSYAVAFVNRRTDGLPYIFKVSLRRILLLSVKGYVLKDLYSNKEYKDVYYPDSELTVKINPTGVIFLKASLR